jgi:hypothetical protein
MIKNQSLKIGFKLSPYLKITVKTLLFLTAFQGVIPVSQANPIADPTDSTQQQHHLTRIVSHLVGVMDTSRQASLNPKQPNVRMTTCLIKVDDLETNHHFLYQEQAMANKLDQPYRQRFLEIFPSENSQQIIAKSYKPVNPDQFKGFCNHNEIERNFTTNQLGEYVCQVILTPVISIYRGETPPEGCKANVRGAVRITNTIILHSQGMDTWDRGFDQEGNQVWGAENESYQFRWSN